MLSAQCRLKSTYNFDHCRLLVNETIKFENVLYKNGSFNNKLSAVENLTLNTGNMAKINNVMLIYHVFYLNANYFS